MMKQYQILKLQVLNLKSVRNWYAFTKGKKKLEIVHNEHQGRIHIFKMQTYIKKTIMYKALILRALK